MKTKFITSLLLLSILSPLSLKAKVALNADYSIAGNYVNDSQIQARILANRVLFDLDYDLLPKLTLHGRAGALYETGSNQSIIINEFQPQSQLVFREAFLRWSPYNALSFDVGAIPTKDYNSPLLITYGPYFGAIEKLGFKGNSFEIYLKLLQSIPNNNNLSRRVGFVSEGTPKFFMETAGLRLGEEKNFFLLEGSTFRFNTLSTILAYNSQFLGNSVSGGSTTNSTYLYNFAGYNFMTKLQYMFNEMYGINFTGQYLYNQKAPDTRNTGYIGLAGLILGDLTLSGGFFENQSDSSPAYYNSRTYGHNNRSGFQFGFESIFPSDDFTIQGYYINSNPIESNLYQSNRVTYLLRLTKSFNLLMK